MHINSVLDYNFIKQKHIHLYTNSVENKHENQSRCINY